MFIGCDPGNTGGLAVVTNTVLLDEHLDSIKADMARLGVDYFNTTSGLVLTARLKTTKVKNTKTVDGRWLNEVLTFVLSLVGTYIAEPVYAAVEHQHARVMVKDGGRRIDKPSTSFSLGFGYGAILQAFLSNEVSVEPVEPGFWQKALKVGKTADDGKAWCLRRFPGVNLVPTGCRTEHDGVIDALMIAEHCRREHLGAQPVEPIEEELL